VVLVIYLTDRLLRLADTTAAVATTALPGLWGLIAVALFADGRWGQGWNQVGITEYRTIAGQGVTGFLAAPGFIGDGPGQSIAQAAGIAAIGLLGLLGGWLTMKTLSALTPPRQALEEEDSQV
jgi:Amt family ammonium transporter